MITKNVTTVTNDNKKNSYHYKMITSDNMIFDDNIFDNINDNIFDNIEYNSNNTNQNISTSFNLTDKSDKSTTCDYCLKQFGHRSGKSRHMKTCDLNLKRKQMRYEELPGKKAKDESCIVYSDYQQQQHFVQQPSDR